MTAIVLCGLVFLVSFLVSRRSLANGLGVVLSVGYVYGITRSNIPEPASHLIFDAAVLGLYLAELRRPLPSGERAAFGGVKAWLWVLIAWPTVLWFLSDVSLMIATVAWRASAFLLPFMWFGARLDDRSAHRLGMLFAVLNIAAFVVAGVQYVIGIEPFFPRVAVTEILYRSDLRDIDGLSQTVYRIPSFFLSAHAFAGTLVLTIPLLVGRWTQHRGRPWESYLLATALGATFLGIFMAATRSHMIVLAVLIVVMMWSGQVWTRQRSRWAIVVVAVAWLVAGDVRLQQFMTLQDTEFLSARFRGSVNTRFLELLGEYPMGKGLGSAFGTSIPYFLKESGFQQIGLENEYSRIALELGMIGLFLWLLFIVWVFTRTSRLRSDPWRLGRRLARCACGCYFVLALTGTGMLASIPQTALFMLSVGWFAVRPRVEAVSARRNSARIGDVAQRESSAA